MISYDPRHILGLAFACALVLPMLAQSASSAVSSIEFHVSADGSDQGPGTQSQPFATLERARDAVRKLKETGGRLPRMVEIVVHGEISTVKPLALDARDSGTPGCTIVYRSARLSRLVGGVLVKGFSQVTDPKTLAMLDETARGQVVQVDLKALGITDFGSAAAGGIELFFNDEPMTLSRWPNEGFVKIVDVLKNKPVDIRGTKGDAVGDIIYDGDRPNRWVKENDGWVHGYWFWDWSDQRQQIDSIDTEKKLIRIKPPYHNYGYRKGQWFYAYNLLSEIDQPGEWYVDRTTGVLYFWPPSDVTKARVVVSSAENAIKADSLSHVKFQGLLVEATRGDGIVITKGSHVLISECQARNTGGLGIRISGSDCTISDCEIYNTGKGGVSIDGGDRIKLIDANNQVIRCKIHNYGRIVRMYSAGVHVSGVGNRVANCVIHDAPHQAIGFGGNNHVFEYNEIYRVCMESNDAGAIYAGRDWSMLDNIVRYNYFHDIRGFENKGCVGVYLDDFFSGTTIYGNVFKNVSRAAMVGGGNYNTIENNVFIDCDPCIHLDARGEGWAKDFFDGTYPDLIPKMKAVDYKSKYYAKYKWLQTAMDEPNPGHPRGNKYNHNVGIGGRWADIEGKAKPDNEFEGNTVTKDTSLLTTDPKTGFPTLTKEAYAQTGLKPIPVEKIGLSKAD
jgi:parallel beta-helix repeat protein